MKKKLIFVALIGLIGLQFGTGCGGGKVTKADCEKAMDKMVDLMAKEQGVDGPALDAAKKAMKEGMASKLDECVKEAKKSEIDCIMKAEKAEDLKNCKFGG